jgi:hypothetical protein
LPPKFLYAELRAEAVLKRSTSSESPSNARAANKNYDLESAFKAGNPAALYEALFTCYPCPEDHEPYPAEEGFVIVPRWAVRAAREQVVRAARAGGDGAGRHARFITRYRKEREDQQCFRTVQMVYSLGISIDEAIDIAADYLQKPSDTLRKARLRAASRMKARRAAQLPEHDPFCIWFELDVVESEGWQDAPATIIDVQGPTQTEMNLINDSSTEHARRHRFADAINAALERTRRKRSHKVGT